MSASIVETVADAIERNIGEQMSEQAGAFSPRADDDPTVLIDGEIDPIELAQAAIAALSSLPSEREQIVASHKWFDPVCALAGCQSLHLKQAERLLREMVMMARTTGGIAGPDSALMAVCAEAEAYIADRRAHLPTTEQEEG